MQINEYQARAVTTAFYPRGKIEYNLAYLGLGLAGEAGEAAEKVKKLLRGDYGLNKETKDKIINELGDVLWYIANLADELGVPMSDVFEANITKLDRRQKNKTLAGDGDDR
jgi:NTP pyrophosphatase (non-canonical NTP hydrolase)